MNSKVWLSNNTVKILPADIRSIVSPQDLPEDFEDEELAQYAAEFTKGELEEAADEYFDLNDWDGIDDATLVAVLEDQEMQM